MESHHHLFRQNGRMRNSEFLQVQAKKNMKIIISEVMGRNGQTFNIFLTKQNIRISWHESDIGETNWVLEFLSNSANSDGKRKVYFSFALDGSKDDMKGWLNKSNAGNENLQNNILMHNTHIQP